MGLSAPGPPAPGTRSPWTTPRAMGLHATLLVVLPAFLGLFWWQVQRVRQGNTLSWAYVFEWPFFAAYAVYLWWHLVHEQPGLESDRSTGREAGTGPGPTASPEKPHDAAATGELQDVVTAAGEATDPTAAREAEELAAYNAYLAQLSASGRQKRW